MEFKYEFPAELFQLPFRKVFFTDFFLFYNRIDTHRFKLLLHLYFIMILTAKKRHMASRCNMWSNVMYSCIYQRPGIKKNMEQNKSSDSNYIF